PCGLPVGQAAGQPRTREEMTDIPLRATAPATTPGRQQQRGSGAPPRSPEHGPPALPQPYPYISRSVLCRTHTCLQGCAVLVPDASFESGCALRHTGSIGGPSWTQSRLQSWASGTVPVRCSRGSNTTGGRAKTTQPG